MTSTREDALAVLGLADRPDADPATVQQAFERRARRYPPASFPDRFRQLLDARDRLLEPGRIWRQQLDAPVLDLAWLNPHLARAQPRAPAPPAQALQDMLRAGYHAEPLPPEMLPAILGELADFDPF